MQDQPAGAKKPLEYWSRTLSPAEQNYHTTLRETLAVFWAILLLRPHLEGQGFKICTDYDALKWFINLAESTGKTAR